MKKIILLIIFGFLLAGLILPMASPALAQIGGQNLNDCCKINAKFSALSVKVGAATTFTDLQFDTKGLCIVGAEGGSCIIDGVDYTTNLAAHTVFGTAEKATCGNTATAEYIAIDGWGIVCLLNSVYIVTNWIFYLMMIAVVIVFVIAGAKYMMSSGDPEKTKSAKNLMIFGIVGLIVALIAKLVPSVIKLIVAM